MNQDHLLEKQETDQDQSLVNLASRPISRKNFMLFSGATAVSAILLQSCSKDDDNTPASADVTLTNDDYGVLNYAYALEQLEAAFYTQVVATPYTGITASEKTMLTDIMYHEVAHVAFLKAALGTKAIGSLTPDFSSIDFTSKTSVLTTAQTFEDLGVSAYNGVAKHIKDANYLLAAGKIVSVEARHAAIIRETLNPNTAAFASAPTVATATGLDTLHTVPEVLAAAGKYIKNKITSNLPTT
ncbi:MAG: ferritin-like domain-containing protein [Bacteroidota bacterium]